MQRTPHHLPTMYIRRVVLTLSAVFTAAVIMPVAAQNGDAADQANYNSIASDLYVSPPAGGFGGIPSGAVNVVPGTTGGTGGPAGMPFISTSQPVTVVSNALGCAGVGQGEFTSALYNMPESFAKFQKDVNSNLSKDLLMMNFVMPQTAALFDQLNNFGNQRYQQFQQGCNLDALKQDAKQQYLNACVVRLEPVRKQQIQQTNTGNNAVVDPQLSAMAYAQAWEICSNQYVSDTTAMDARTTALRDFATKVRELENVNVAIEPLLCAFEKQGNLGGAEQACWAKFLVPQVKVCLDPTIEGGCNAEGGYGTREPQISTIRMFDTLRYIMDEIVVGRRVVDFNRQMTIGNLAASLRTSAAGEAALSLSAATLGRSTTAVGSASGTMLTGGDVSAYPDASVAAFQLGYLNCKNPDILNPLREYAKVLNRRLTDDGQSTREANATGGTIRLVELRISDYKPVIDNLRLHEPSADEITALQTLAWVSLGCTANQAIPIFDPNIMASLHVQCTPQDRYAFYTMASHDVALTATRDIYRFLNLRLKQVYTQLLTQPTVPQKPESTTSTSGTQPGATAAAPLVSKELNARLAAVVKDTMIPYVESQIARLNDLSATRGEFGTRVREIYSNKTGCVGGGGR